MIFSVYVDGVTCVHAAKPVLPSQLVRLPPRLCVFVERVLLPVC